jgi:hypothetical protein
VRCRSDDGWCAREFDRGFAADFVSRRMVGLGSPGLRLGLASDARFAGCGDGEGNVSQMRIGMRT